MAESWDKPFLLIVTAGLLRHHVGIPILKFDNCPLSYGFALLEPLVMQGRTVAERKSQTNNSLSLLVTVESNPAFADIIIVVSFRDQFLPLWKVQSEVFPDFVEKWGLTPRDNRTFSFLKFWVLGLISKAEVVSCQFVDNFAIHQHLLIPIKSRQLTMKLFNSRFPLPQKALNSSFNDQDAGIISRFLQILIQIHEYALVATLLKLLLRQLKIFPRVAILSLFSYLLHASVVLRLVPKGNGDSAHILLLTIQRLIF